MSKIDLDKVSEDSYKQLNEEYECLMSYAADMHGNVDDSIKRAVVKCGDAIIRYDDMFKERKESKAKAIAQKWSRV